MSLAVVVSGRACVVESESMVYIISLGFNSK